jgi:FlaA1/EpsC-like NDP-sugar epimerase
MEATKRILFFGATGAIGKPILEELVKNVSIFEHIAIFTSPGGASKKEEFLAELKSKGVKVVMGDIFNEAQVLEAYKGWSPNCSKAWNQPHHPNRN